jgi:hypothetical protein
MGTKVRCKFNCHYKSSDGKQIEFSPVYTGSEENKSFFEATPGGHIILNTVNAEASAHFEVGKEYYIDFTLAN